MLRGILVFRGLEETLFVKIRHDQDYWFFILEVNLIWRMNITEANMSETQIETAKAMEEKVLNTSTVADAFRVMTDLAFE